MTGSQPAPPDLFEPAMIYPDAEAQVRLARLVGLEEHKLRLSKILGLLVNPAGLEKWLRTHHPGADQLLSAIRTRPPLVILAGEVGSGKTELAETICDSIARNEGIEITLLPLRLSTRGHGLVGEMTQLLSAAFDATLDEARRFRCSSGRARGAVILLVDEADALAQSREASQMHHEDRAGVNVLIRGVDRIGRSRLPAAVIMCTNRLTALDPSVSRRAADILVFGRPDDDQRRRVLSSILSALDFSSAEVETLVEVTGPRNGRTYGFTFSDLVQRLLPAIALDAYPTQPVNPSRAVELARSMEPTPPFKESR